MSNLLLRLNSTLEKTELKKERIIMNTAREDIIVEVEEKKKRVLTLLDRKDLDGLILKLKANFSWFTAGGDAHVELGYEESSASLVIFPEQVYIFTTNIERGRLVEEELDGLGFEVKSEPWYREGDRLKKLINSYHLGADIQLPGTIFLGEEISRLRYQLLPPEKYRLKKLGGTAARSLSEVCREITPGMSEHEVAGLTGAKLLQEGMQPVVILIGSDERIFNYRHPIPTSSLIDSYVMVVVCARLWGLVVSLTRLVYFGSLPSELKRKMEAVRKIEAVFYGETRPGHRIEDILQEGQKAYRREGYPGEWKKHHQGGAAGYATRDYLARPDLRNEKVLRDQTFAWNPSIAGVKSEDTIIAEKSGIDIVTADQNWPATEFEYGKKSFSRPDILCR